ncbi:type VI secretion system baseplate subunit TssE [Glaciimonas sp. PAMC28666]|uniref:type VI secretion system baseplate subunit TssE n=1 Tax=Glaciimonas sp. PAMC28666 TaxID=2807626 RepID=UPI001963F58C|nr:type VI secretion system baseplate subunit TssE [Glaciimonas sp. PAMC28666]QRX83121.1 type VI secretion system baseplate subunit TssE [Glaciimonas sp. PAMC28666]
MATGPSLYDMLMGHVGAVPLGDYDNKTLEILSVMENLRRILNTRAGSLKHLPDFGLPDLTNVYRNLPASAHALKNQMEATLLIYEPRISGIEIEVLPADPGMVISYEMTCHLRKQGLVRFGTHFEPEGRTLLQLR